MPTLVHSTAPSDDHKRAFEEKFEQLRVQEKEDLAKISAAKYGLPYIALKTIAISPDTIALVKRDEAEKAKMVVFARAGNNIRVGAIDPLHPLVGEILSRLQEVDGLAAELYLISDYSFQRAMRLYENVVTPKTILGVEISPDDVLKAQEELKRVNDLKDAVRRLPVTELLGAFIGGAINFRATDIHFEAQETEVHVRYRIDGILHLLAALPKESWHRISTRIKILSRLKINVSNQPQDGSFKIILPHESIDVRVSILPTEYGESIALRLLMSSATAITVEQLGLRGQALEIIQKEIARPNGMLIATGPTGAGKSTTLYAILSKLNTDERKIITLEDPIEYKIPGIMQSQVDTSKNYTFANGLRSILRQDPDVVMVGEIRDLPTADTAIQAALTGHLVLSTLHTNSAAAAIPRFLSLGTKSFLLAPALNVILAQRLVRKICEQCRVALDLEPDVAAQVTKILSDISPASGFRVDPHTLHFSKGNGCDHCHGLGYFGRVGVFEVLHVTPEVQQLIMQETSSEYDVLAAAQKSGMITMVQDGLLKALDGITTVEEVFRVAE